MHPLPETGFVRIRQILGRKEITAEEAAFNRAAGRRDRCPHPGAPPIIPVCASSWWTGVRTGRYPAPVKLGATTVWRVEDIRALIERTGRGG